MADAHPDTDGSGDGALRGPSDRGSGGLGTLTAERTASPGQATPSGPSRRRSVAGAARALVRPVAVYAVSRVVTLTAFALAATLDEPTTTLGALGRWDSTWYTRVVEEGYPSGVPEQAGEALQSTLAFFPLYPLAVRAVQGLTGLDALPAAVAANAVFGVTFAVALWLLVRRLAGPAAADRTVVLAAFFPGAFVLSMAYSEPLMLTLAAACLLFLVDRRWLAAGVAAALATATRPNAVALVAACAWAAFAAVRRDRDWGALVAPALAPAGFVAFLGFVWWRTGEAGAWFRVQREGWQEHTDLGVATLQRLRATLDAPFQDQNVLWTTLGFLTILVLLALLWRWRPPGPVVAYTVVVVALALGSATLGGRPRFVLTAFPLLAALAVHVRGAVFATVAASFAALLGMLTIVTATSLYLTP